MMHLVSPLRDTSACDALPSVHLCTSASPYLAGLLQAVQKQLAIQTQLAVQNQLVVQKLMSTS